jgi:methionyl aminopeptidase
LTAETELDVQGLKRAGRVAALVLAKMLSQVRAGITTQELDRIGEKEMARLGAQSAPRTQYNFPGATCISVNEVVAHGIPGERRLKAGDKVNIDVSVELDGYFADTGATVIIPPAGLEGDKLCRAARSALSKALRTAQAGRRLNEVGRAVEEEAQRFGFTVVRNLCGHGVGRRLHEEPRHILNFYHPDQNQRLEKGMVLAIEPFVSMGEEFVEEAGDGWTLITPKGSWVAQFEHTIIVTEQDPIIITAL